MFLAYVNDMIGDLKCTEKLLADDSSLVTTVYDTNVAADDINSDLEHIKLLIYRCMSK